MIIFDKLKVLNLIYVHRHQPPRCGHGNHDPSCVTPEIICRVIGKGAGKYCLCVHLKPAAVVNSATEVRC